jgi:hypothetical protein
MTPALFLPPVDPPRCSQPLPCPWCPFAPLSGASLPPQLLDARTWAAGSTRRARAPRPRARFPRSGPSPTSGQGRAASSRGVPGARAADKGAARLQPRPWRRAGGAATSPAKAASRCRAKPVARAGSGHCQRPPQRPGTSCGHCTDARQGGPDSRSGCPSSWALQGGRGGSA